MRGEEISAYGSIAAAVAHSITQNFFRLSCCAKTQVATEQPYTFLLTGSNTDMSTSQKKIDFVVNATTDTNTYIHLIYVWFLEFRKQCFHPGCSNCLHSKPLSYELTFWLSTIVLVMRHNWRARQPFGRRRRGGRFFLLSRPVIMLWALVLKHPSCLVGKQLVITSFPGPNPLFAVWKMQ